MNILDHISKRMGTIFGLKIFKTLLCGFGSGIRNLFDPGSGIRDTHPSSAASLVLGCVKCLFARVRFLLQNISDCFWFFYDI
jgi:hypothetical protein